MPSCAVFGCKNNNRSTKGKEVRYFQFPKQDDLAKQWIELCGRKDKINLKNGNISILY